MITAEDALLFDTVQPKKKKTFINVYNLTLWCIQGLHKKGQ